MEEIGATIPKYQPLQVLWHPLCDYARRTILSRPIRPFTRQLVPSLFEESISRSSSTLIQPFFWYSLINAFLSPQKFLHSSRFFSLFVCFFYFHCTLFSGACRSFREPRKFFSNSLFIHSLVCLITHSFLHGFQPNLYQHFSYVCSTCHTIISLK